MKLIDIAKEHFPKADIIAITCPHLLGLASKPDYCCEGNEDYDICKKCWEREVEAVEVD